MQTSYASHLLSPPAQAMLQSPGSPMIPACARREQAGACLPHDVSGLGKATCIHVYVHVCTDVYAHVCRHVHTYVCAQLPSLQAITAPDRTAGISPLRPLKVVSAIRGAELLLVETDLSGAAVHVPCCIGYIRSVSIRRTCRERRRRRPSLAK